MVSPRTLEPSPANVMNYEAFETAIPRPERKDHSKRHSKGRVCCNVLLPNSTHDKLALSPFTVSIHEVRTMPNTHGIHGESLPVPKDASGSATTCLNTSLRHVSSFTSMTLRRSTGRIGIHLSVKRTNCSR
jgi:hypothetical protein